MSLTPPADDPIAVAEEACLDAEAWAGELEDWLKRRPGDARGPEMGSIARMLRALVKSIRLSIVADEDEENRRYLVEELFSTMQNARNIASGAGADAPLLQSRTISKTPPIFKRVSDRPTAPPPAAAETKPPPSKLSPRDLFELSDFPDLPEPRRKGRPDR